MIDFLLISTRSRKPGQIEIYPKFIIKRSSDLMIRGGDFYAIWLEDRGLWSTDEQDAIQLIDRELDRYAEENKKLFDGSHVKVLHLWDAETGMIDSWHKYCQKQMRDNYHMLDEKLIFSNSETNKKDYASKRLPYPLEPGSIEAYDKLISTLYTEEERHKLEWAIGSIVHGDSKKIQKFMVLYGPAGSGKSTILNVIQQLFEGYYSVFDAKALGSASSSFALEAFKTNPLVAIQHDGDLSKIEDNTRLNSLVSHELMTVNEKFKSTYASSFKCFLFMGTNRPVKITDAKSGLLRRLIDVTPSGNKVEPREYKRLIHQVKFELGAIAQYCLEVYEEDPGYYDDYVPISMLDATNDFYNFMIDSYSVFKREDGTTLKAAWEMYKNYCEEAKLTYPYTLKIFKEELKNYFREFSDRFNFDDGSRSRSYYSGFRTEKFEVRSAKKEVQAPEPETSLIQFQTEPSIFDSLYSEYPAQYANEEGTPKIGWAKVKTKLKDLDISQLHYVNIPENHIVIDFDLKDKDGNKDFERNLRAASKWPATYAEVSKSGGGIHLHYIWTGEDVNTLSRVYDDNIEVKVYTGDQALRRKFTKCNTLPIATLSSGLPTKGEKMVNFDAIKSEKALRTLIKKNLNKEYHASTKSSIDFIYKILNDAYSSDMGYDVSDMRNAVLSFGANSTNNADYCIKLVNKMSFKSADPSEAVNAKGDDSDIIFYDVEVFPNLFLVNWKLRGKGKPVVRMINPKPDDIEELIRHKLVGFNCRRYDNHMLYACLMGYDNEAIYRLSQKIINSKKGENQDAFFNEAYNISYTDIYDFSTKKQSLKKWEIELGIHHHELGLPWDQPVPKEMWSKVAEYCDDDVLATEAVFEHLSGDWTARQILADLADGTVNDTTNSLTTKFIFGNNRKPQSQFHYRNLAEPVFELDEETHSFLSEVAPEMMSQTHGEAGSLLPYFPGYKFDHGKSTYRDEEVGEGGYVYAEPGIHRNVALLDIASMHPTSVICEVLFGPEFTRRFKEIVYGRVHIKHEAWEEVNKMLDGKLTPYIQKVLNGEMTSKQLANALKIAINSVYGLTSASFTNAFRDGRNKDNIVAKRGALFMIDLKHEVQKRGFTVAHIKTDSIKIPDATPEIIEFVYNFGKQYGYTFEHEATYDRMCLINQAVYVAQYQSGEWTATGTQFQIPYVFKTLFSKEAIEFSDLCETKQVNTSLYLDMNETLPDVHLGENIKKLREVSATDETKLTKKDIGALEAWSHVSDEELDEYIAEGHSYQFIGKVGSFCPIKPGCGGGELMRYCGDGKYMSATGAKDYRWLESELVRENGREDDIDRTYYRNLVDAAIEEISKYGNFDEFVA